jgi:hypothetical protein
LLGFKVTADLPHRLSAAVEHLVVQYTAAVLRHEDQVDMQSGNHMHARL